MTRALSEFGLIAEHFRPLATHDGALARGDDACVLAQQSGWDTIITADALTAGVHFLADGLPGKIAAKALRTTLSDLAAKGAEPVGYLLALALPQATTDAWLEGFARGLRDDQDAFGISLLGGDTTATPGPLTIAITAFGRAPTGLMIRRSGAKPGDSVFVSGTIGDAGAGLEVLRAGADDDFLAERYWLPAPRLGLGRQLRGIASASLDVSDGLLADLGHIAGQSRVHIVVEVGAVPLSPSLRAIWPGLDGSVRAVTAGDDYEIAFTAPDPDNVARAAAAAGVTVTRIGRVTAGEGVSLVNAEGDEIPITRAGFTHF